MVRTRRGAARNGSPIASSLSAVKKKSTTKAASNTRVKNTGKGRKQPPRVVQSSSSSSTDESDEQEENDEGSFDNTLCPEGVNGLQETLYESIKRIIKFHKNLRLQVIGIYRYIADPVATSQLQGYEGALGAKELYDVVLSDGSMKNKFFWSPHLNPLIHTGTVKLHTVLSVNDVSTRYFTRNNDLCAYYVVNSIKKDSISHVDDTVLLANNEHVGRSTESCLESLVFHSYTLKSRPRLIEARPMLSSRQYYLPLHNDDGFPAVPKTDLALSPSSICNWGDTSSLTIINDISTLLTNDKEHFEPRPCFVPLTLAIDKASNKKVFAPLVGIVQYKTSVTHFGKSNVRNSVAVKFDILLRDGDDEIKVVFWGAACCKYFYAINAGDVIQIRKYKLKKFENQLEVAVNFAEPEYTEVLQVNDVVAKQLVMLKRIKIGGDNNEEKKATKDFSDGLQLLSYNFMDIQQVSDSVATIDTFDFIGVITWVGTSVYEKSVAHNEEEDFFLEHRKEYCYIKLFDSSSDCELTVKLYASSQEEAFNTLKPGDELLLTNLRCIITSIENHHRQLENEPTVVYNTTSTATTLILSHQERIAALQTLYPEVDAVISWWSTLQRTSRCEAAEDAEGCDVLTGVPYDVYPINILSHCVRSHAALGYNLVPMNTVIREIMPELRVMECRELFVAGIVTGLEIDASTVADRIQLSVASLNDASLSMTISVIPTPIFDAIGVDSNTLKESLPAEFYDLGRLLPEALQLELIEKFSSKSEAEQPMYEFFKDRVWRLPIQLTRLGFDTSKVEARLVSLCPVSFDDDANGAATSE